MRAITLLTDFGTADYYVAAMKGVLLDVYRTRGGDGTPALVDLTHDVAPGDVEGAAFLLAAAAPAFPAGTVHLAVVDPGVGTARRLLAAERGGHRFLAPDNGLLDGLLDGARVVAVERPDLYRDAPGHTFHGRDRFAPVAAALAAGEPLARLGPPVADARRLGIAPPRRDGPTLHGRVAHVDRYGNLVTDLPAAWLPVGARVEVGSHAATRRVATYAELGEGEPGWLVGSLGTVELSLRGASLAARWGVGRGAAVRAATANAATGPSNRDGKRGRNDRRGVE